MLVYGDKTYLQGRDYYDNLPEQFRSHALISECYHRLDFTVFETYSEYVGQGIMDYFGLTRRFGDPNFATTNVCEHMLKHLETLQDENAYYKAHYLYMWIGDLYYKSRNNAETPFAMSKAVENYEKDIELLPFFSRQSRPMAYPSLKRLIAIYEKAGDLERAISLTEMAIVFKIPIQYEYENKKEQLKKKLLKRSK